MDTNNNDIQEQIKSGLMAFYHIAKNDVRKRWNDMDKTQKLASARSLTEMWDVAKNPEQYLSEEKTREAWLARAAQCVKDHDIKPEYVADAIYLVDTPAQMVSKAAKNALVQPLRNQYGVFLHAIQKYEYDNTFLKKYYAEDIKNLSREIKDMSKAKNTIATVMRKVKDIVK